MAMRSQVYEWANLSTGGTGYTIRRVSGATPVALTSDTNYDIFIGGVGNNITKPAETTATQFVVIEDLACSTVSGGAVQIRINTTDYFQNPDVTVQGGVPGLASPYPVGSSTDGGETSDNCLSSFDLYPDVYVLPGQTWTVLYKCLTAISGGATASSTSVAAFVKYTLYDGPDALIANKLLEMGVTVNPNNVDWYKRTLIEQGGVQ